MANNKIVFGNEVLIDLTSDDVEASDVAKGKKFHGRDGEIYTGTSTLDADTSDADALASEILLDKIAYVKGTKITGTMPNIGKQESTITDVSDSIAISRGYHDGTGTVKIDDAEKAKIIPANIKSGAVLLGVTGTYTGEGVKAQSKTATPYLTAQTILPDAEYDYLSQVEIAAISRINTPNSAGGTTVTIGDVAPVTP